MVDLAASMEAEQKLRLALRDAGGCECCGTAEGTELRSSMTAYHFEGPENSDDNPNRRWLGCATCWSEYESYWQAMWDEYHASRGC
jgi:hypothetical protein